MRSKKALAVFLLFAVLLFVAAPINAPTTAQESTQAQPNTFYAGPDSTVAGKPRFRKITAKDLGTGTANASKLLRGDMAWADLPAGSVFSVGLALPSIFMVTGSPVTTSGTLTAAFNTQPANFVFAGPASGGAAVPAFRALAAADFGATLAAFSAFNSNGLMVQTSANNFTARSIAVTANTGLSITNGDGIADNPTLAGVNATTSVKGVASFNSTNFSVTSGAVNLVQNIATVSKPRFGGLIIGNEFGGYVTSGAHGVQINSPVGTQTPLFISGGSGAAEIWKTPPTGSGDAGVGFGMAVPTFAATSDFLNSTYTTATGWLERTRIDSTTGNFGIGTGAGPTAKLDINSDTFRLRTAKTPASSSAACNAGDFAWDANFIYVCVAANTWHRSAHSTW